MPKVADPALLAQLNSGRVTDPTLLGQLGVIARMQGTGPKAPSGYRSTATGDLAAISGGPDDIGVAARRAGAEAAARAAVERGLIADRKAAALDQRRQEKAMDEVGEALDPSTINYYAQQVLAGAPLPAMGMGKQAAAARQAIMQQVARLGGAAGLTGADQAAQLAHYQAGKKQIGTLENMAGTIGVNEQTALANGQQFLDRSAELPGQTRFAPLNALSDAIQRRFGGTTISAADAAYNTFVNEYAKVVAGSPSGAGTLSDSARHEAMSTISGSGSLAQKQAAFDQMKTDMANRMTAIHGGISNAYKALTNQPGYSVPDTTHGLMVGTNGASRPEGGRGDPSGGVPPVNGGGNSGGGSTLASGATRFENNAQAEAIIDRLVRQGSNANTINAALDAVGWKGRVQQKDVAETQAYLKVNPGYSGFAEARQEVKNGLLARAANSAPGAAVASFADAILPAGVFGEQSAANMKALKDAFPDASLVGSLAGIGGGIAAAGGLTSGLAAAGARAGGLAGRVLANPLTADASFGALYGAAANPQDRLGGAVAGGALAGGLGYGLRGLAGTAPVANAANRVRGMFGGGVVPVSDVSAPAASVLNAASKAGIDNVRGNLRNAADLGVPMSLADASTPLTSLAGATVRRSPAAAQLAENTLLQRARGQIDRLRTAVARDLGPVANIPQQSAALQERARAAAAPLYDAAYANAVPTTPELDSLLKTPFGRQAVARARTIAANERRNPTELGFALDADGNAVLNPQPYEQIAGHLDARAAVDEAQDAYRTARTTAGADTGAARDQLTAAREQLRQAETTLKAAPDPGKAASVPAYTQQALDYVKRGMDDVLEQQRNPLTGRLQLDEAGRAQNDVLRSLLTENDRLNPAFGAARAAYAGPASAKEALGRGVDAFSLTPDELAMQVGNQSPEHLAQMQLGYRAELMNRANAVRDASNPFEATLGSPAARARVDALYPGNTGNARLFATRDAEQGLARSTNAILGNSRTAERGIADQAFAGGNLPSLTLDAGLMAAGHVPVATIAKTLGGGALRDAYTFGVGKRAVAKADEIAPLLFNANPAQSEQSLIDLLAQRHAYRRYINNAAPRRLAGMFGAGLGGLLGASSVQ